MKVFKNPIFMFILGVFISSGLMVFAEYAISADKIEYSKNVSVKDKIDDLYTKVKPTYNGSTTVTPSKNSQTLNTNGKILNSDITINEIPSTYKNISDTTIINANDIATGKIAYTKDGTKLTGTFDSAMHLLWTNPNPSNAFQDQTINLNLGNYKYIVVDATYGGNGLTNDYYAGHKTIIEVGTTSAITGIYYSADGGAATVRKVTTTTSSVRFYSGKFFNGNNNISDNYAVPLHIYGIK